ncbi:MAG: hypothetical protein WCD11_22230 [Solirubrobacteraceae bacterium]
MFRSIRRLLIAATMIVALSAPSAAFGFIRVTSGGASASGQASRANTAANSQLLALVQTPTAAQASIVPSVPRATASSSEGFQWGDAGVGAAGVIVLLGAGAGAAGVLRQRRVHRPIAG